MLESCLRAHSPGASPAARLGAVAFTLAALSRGPASAGPALAGQDSAMRGGAVGSPRLRRLPRLQ